MHNHILFWIYSVYVFRNLGFRVTVKRTVFWITALKVGHFEGTPYPHLQAQILSKARTAEVVGKLSCNSFQPNSEVHNVNTRQTCDTHRISNLKCLKKVHSMQELYYIKAPCQNWKPWHDTIPASIKRIPFVYHPLLHSVNMFADLHIFSSSLL